MKQTKTKTKRNKWILGQEPNPVHTHWLKHVQISRVDFQFPVCESLKATKCQLFNLLLVNFRQWFLGVSEDVSETGD